MERIFAEKVPDGKKEYVEPITYRINSQIIKNFKYRGYIDLSIFSENDYGGFAYYILSLNEDNQHFYDKIFTYLNTLRNGNIKKVLNKDVYSKIIKKFDKDTGFGDIIKILLLNYRDLFDIDDNI